MQTSSKNNAYSSDTFVVEGLGGKKTLQGEIEVYGAKNAALKMLAATLLYRDTVTLTNVPRIEDVRRIADLLEQVGMRVTKDEKQRMYTLHASDTLTSDMSPNISRKIRASVVLIGPLLARLGKVSFPHPGGCVIGARPIDIFLDGFEKMGATISEEKDMYTLEAARGKLNGATLFLKHPSVTATETFMMAAVLAEGETVIKNAALEPEIEHLADYLNQTGARITGAGSPTITIEGNGLLTAGDTAYATPPDRIEAGSFVLLAALAGKDITVKNCNPYHVEALLTVLSDAGVIYTVDNNSIRIVSKRQEENQDYTSTNIKTLGYPGFPTDLQAPMTVFLTQVTGESLVFETIFEGRLNYTEALMGMGAHITMMDPHRVLVQGPAKLKGKNLESPDLRAGLAFVLAGIVAAGTSTIHNVYNIDRGYEQIEKRLAGLGVSIKRHSDRS